MADRLTDLLVGLQRLAEGARLRGEDLEYVQRAERHEYVQYLDQLLLMTEKLRSSLLEDRKRFLPERERPAQIPQDEPRMPRVVRPAAQQS
jgi:hypothetical protein